MGIKEKLISLKNKYIFGTTFAEIMDEICPIQTIFVLTTIYYFGFVTSIIINAVTYFILSTILEKMGYEWVKGIDSIAVQEIHPVNIRN